MPNRAKKIVSVAILNSRSSILAFESSGQFRLIPAISGHFRLKNVFDSRLPPRPRTQDARLKTGRQSKLVAPSQTWSNQNFLVVKPPSGEFALIGVHSRLRPQRKTYSLSAPIRWEGRGSGRGEGFRLDTGLRTQDSRPDIGPCVSAPLRQMPLHPRAWTTNPYPAPRGSGLCRSSSGRRLRQPCPTDKLRSLIARPSAR